MQQIRSSFPPTLPELVPGLNEACKEQQKITAKQQGAMERQQKTIAELSGKVEELTRLVLLKGAVAGVTGE